LWYIFILSVITYYTIMVICIIMIIYHTYICLLFRLPLLLQRLQLVILFYFIISHITLHDTLFISVSTCFIVSYWVFYYIFHYYY
jgi:hypothetical protein